MKSLAVAVVLAVAGCNPTLTTVADMPSPTVALADPPYVADAAGVPQPAAGDTAISDAAAASAPETVPTSPVAPIIPGPDGSSVFGRCTQWADLLYYFQPAGGWDIDRMSRYAWRESNCTPTVRSRTRDSGLWQINDINHRYLRTALGEWVDRYTLLDPVQNVRAAAALCTYWRNAGRSCYRPWN